MFDNSNMSKYRITVILVASNSNYIKAVAATAGATVWDWATTYLILLAITPAMRGFALYVRFYFLNLLLSLHV